MHEKPDDNYPVKDETSRIELFSDGVFAIAITMLILELISILHVHTSEPLLKHLSHHLSAFLAFGIGFLTILICWINHRLAFTYIVKSNSCLLWVNGFVLLMVTFTPFPAGILSEYFNTDSHAAMSVFGFNFFMMSVAAYCLSAYAYRKHLIVPSSRDFFKYYQRLYKYCIPYTFIVFFICFVSVPLAVLFYIVMFIIFAFPGESAAYLQRRAMKQAAITKQNKGNHVES